MANTTSPAKDSSVRYTITVELVRPVRYENEDDVLLSAQEEWRLSSEAKRQVEREILRAMRVLDGDADCEVMGAEIVTEDAR